MAETENRIDWFCQQLKERARANPEVMDPAINKMIDQYSKMENDNHRSSACVCFGKYSGVALARNKRILVQPASMSRRVLQGSKSRKRRPTDSVNGASLPKRSKNPHSLNKCVEQNVSLGKTHHAK